MKRFIILLVALFTLVCFPAFAKDVYVKGYTRKDGTVVQPHYRSAPDGNPNNNWSTKGNVNPYTGQPGYKDPNPGYNNPYGNPYQQDRKKSGY